MAPHGSPANGEAGLDPPLEPWMGSKLGGVMWSGSLLKSTVTRKEGVCNTHLGLRAPEGRGRIGSLESQYGCSMADVRSTFPLWSHLPKLGW